MGKILQKMFLGLFFFYHDCVCFMFVSWEGRRDMLFLGWGGGEWGVGRGRATITCTTVELLELKNHGAAAHSSWPARYGFV